MIAIANDHAGLALKQEILTQLKEMKLEYKDFGTNSPESTDYALWGYPAACAVASGECDKGILICGTGAGMMLTANKVKGIRAVVCSETFTAEYARAHNDANILCFGARVVGPGLAGLLVKTFLTTPFEGGRHQRRVNQIMAVEAGQNPATCN
jgi:ribose 5-phosphate isomerase B